MTLAKLLQGVTVTKMFQTVYGRMAVTQDIEVQGIQYDSRRIGHEQLFVAIPGMALDGHSFIGEAIHRGATVVVVQDDAVLPDSYFQHASVTKIVVPDSRKALATMSANLYNHPSARLRLVGVTGTNGKTTTSYLIKAILEERGERVGLIGTIQHMMGDTTIPATHTTPESLDLNALLASMVEKGCTAAVMEVSSHSLSLSRVHGLDFAAAVFTNLTQDHLDFHGSMEEYFKAKKLLFDSLSPVASAITNADDSYGKMILQDTKGRKLSYGSSTTADIRAHSLDLSVQGTTFSVNYEEASQRVESSLIGRFNVANILAAYASGIALGIPHQHIATGISHVPSVRGRFERIVSPQGWTAVVDYAHTPDALENCLRTIRDLLPPKKDNRGITIFGCGGTRDRGKRPKMARIATQLSDVTIITSDNPRKEDPQTIIDEIRNGTLSNATVYTEVDRHNAIIKGLTLAQQGDVVLVAGKGHEDYQVAGETKTHFDDREEIETFIRNSQ